MDKPGELFQPIPQAAPGFDELDGVDSMASSPLIQRRDFLTKSLSGLVAAGLLSTQSGLVFAAPESLIKAVEAVADSNPLKQAMLLALESLEKLEKVDHYSATFVKRELIGRRTLNARMALKVREKPFSVYLKFDEPNKGREVLYIVGDNNNQLRVRETGIAGLAGTMNLDPNGSFAMDGNKYPVTDIGLRTMVTKLLQTWLEDSKANAAQVTVTENTRVEGVSGNLVDVQHQVKAPHVKCARIQLITDSKSGLPIRVLAYDFAPGPRASTPLIEDYYYQDLVVNGGLTDTDFSPRNPQYRF